MPARRSIDDLLAYHLAIGATLRDAAAAVGVSERTARRRQATPAFREQVAALRREWIEACQHRLVVTAVEAIETLRELLRHNKPAVRFKAASMLLELWLKCEQTTAPPPPVDVGLVTEALARYAAQQAPEVTTSCPA